MGFSQQKMWYHEDNMRYNRGLKEDPIHPTQLGPTQER